MNIKKLDHLYKKLKDIKRWKKILYKNKEIFDDLNDEKRFEIFPYNFVEEWNDERLQLLQTSIELSNKMVEFVDVDNDFILKMNRLTNYSNSNNDSFINSWIETIDEKVFNEFLNFIKKSFFDLLKAS